MRAGGPPRAGRPGRRAGRELQGGAERLGLTYEEVARDNPGLVWCSISGFGRGAGAELPGYDFLVQAMSGLMSITGPAPGRADQGRGGPGRRAHRPIRDHRHPGRPPGAVPDRRGQRVEVSLLGSALASLVNQASSFLSTGTPPRAMGNRHPSITPYETLATADRPLVVAVGNDGQFARLCRALGRDELAADPRFATNAGRVTNRDELAALLEEALAARGAADWVAALAEAGVPCGLVNDVGEAFALAQRLGLDPVADAGGIPRWPIRSACRRPRSPTVWPRRSSASTPPRCCAGWPQRRSRTYAFCSRIACLPGTPGSRKWWRLCAATRRVKEGPSR